MVSNEGIGPTYAARGSGPEPVLGMGCEQSSDGPAAQREESTPRVVLVTGGSRGLGAEICRAFASSGASLVVASRKRENCERVAAELSAEHGVETLALEVNVSDWDQCDQLVDDTLEHFGRLDVLVNNAGMSPLYPSLVEVGEELFDKVMGVNLKGPFRLACLAGEHMRSRGGGAIVNVSSVEAVRPEAHALPYAAAKAGLEALTLGLAGEFAPQVRVNAIRCGMFDTDIAKAWGDPADVADMARSRVPLERLGEPGEAASAALFLASPQGSYCTGTVMTVDGGVGL